MMEEPQVILHSDHFTRASADFSPSIHKRTVSREEGGASSCGSQTQSHSTLDNDEEEPKLEKFEPFSHGCQHVAMSHYCTASPLKPIIRRDDTKLDYVKVEGPWRRLPKLDISTIQQQRMNLLRDRSVLQEGVRPISHRGGNVVFDSVKIRSYSQTLGDNPSVSYGPPIQLDWDYEDDAPVPIDEYEGERRPRRQVRELALNYYQRCNALTYFYGVSETDIKTAQKEVEKITRERNFTKMTLPYMFFEEVLESAGRKARRLVSVGRRGR